MKPAIPALAAALIPWIASAQGDLTPPGGAPTAGMKTLTQIEPRIPISAAGTYAVKGSYYLTQNITVTTGSAVTLSAAGSSLDLNGFTISSTSASPSGAGVNLNASDIAVFNGQVAGPGFINGVYAAGSSFTNLRARDISVTNCSEKGIHLGEGEGTSVESCSVRTITSTNSSVSRGIRARLVRGSVATDCSFAGIAGETVMDCRATVNSSGLANSVAISAQSVGGCTAENFSASPASLGIFSDGPVTNSRATTTAATAINGLSVSNCTAITTTGNGIFGFSTTNCHASSDSGIGISGGTVSFCYSSRTTAGTAIQCTNAIGCAVAGTGVVVTAPNKSLGTP